MIKFVLQAVKVNRGRQFVSDCPVSFDLTHSRLARRIGISVSTSETTVRYGHYRVQTQPNGEEMLVAACPEAGLG